MQTIFSIKPCRCGNWLFILLGLLILLTCSTTADCQDATGNTFYQDTKHGWFWYEDPLPEPSKPEKQGQEQAADPPAGKPSRKNPSLDTYSIDDIWNLHPDDFQGLLNDLQKKAVQYPTEENILQYLTMQDVARRKALAYTNASMYVTQKYGNLFNVGQVYPAAKPGVTARVTIEQNEITRTISRARENHGLVFFVNSGCGFCAKQARILAYFTEKYGWPVKTVDIEKEENAATRFNITTTPTLLLIKKGRQDYMAVASGVITLSELERKLYRAIRYLGKNTREDNFLMYDFQKGSGLDPTSILNKGKQPWKRGL